MNHTHYSNARFNDERRSDECEDDEFMTVASELARQWMKPGQVLVVPGEGVVEPVLAALRRGYDVAGSPTLVTSCHEGWVRTANIVVCSSVPSSALAAADALVLLTVGPEVAEGLLRDLGTHEFNVDDITADAPFELGDAEALVFTRTRPPVWFVPEDQVPAPDWQHDSNTTLTHPKPDPHPFLRPDCPVALNITFATPAHWSLTVHMHGFRDREHATDYAHQAALEYNADGAACGTPLTLASGEVPSFALSSERIYIARPGPDRDRVVVEGGIKDLPSLPEAQGPYERVSFEVLGG